jgi:hypothetical protein
MAAAPRKTTLCRECASAIPITAKKCKHCASYQSLWRDILGNSVALTSLFVTVLSLSTVAWPQASKWLGLQRPKLRASVVFPIPLRNEEELLVTLANEGNETAIVTGLSLSAHEQPMRVGEFDGAATVLMPINRSGPIIVPPNSSQVVRYRLTDRVEFNSKACKIEIWANAPNGDPLAANYPIDCERLAGITQNLPINEDLKKIEAITRQLGCKRDERGLLVCPPAVADEARPAPDKR